MKIIIRNIKAPLVDTEEHALKSAAAKLGRERISYNYLSLSKRSVDARKKQDIHFVCSVTADVNGSVDDRRLERLGAVRVDESGLMIKYGDEPLGADPVIVGFGPCGMFTALLLAENGYSPTVIERGGDVDSRKRSVERFRETGELDTNSNIQFGAGGAGTFSDGKLITRINDPRCSYVLERLAEFGAPADIMINAKPHIGTDLLERVVKNVAAEIERLGGRIYYNTRLEKINTDASGRAYSITSDKGDIPCGTLTLATGHSARDTYKYLIENSYDVIPKAFSVGVRIEHLQSEINEAMYGDQARLLPPAEYSLSKRQGERGVYSFCMCPGGEVVGAASEEGGVVTNGMSRHARDGKNSNSALAVSVLQSDYGNSALGAIEFQRELERRAFAAGGGDYSAPLQTVGDFLTGRSGSEPTKVTPSYMGGRYALSDVGAILPGFVTEMLKDGISSFARQIEGFDAPYALLTGVETRTSAPVRIVRGASGTTGGHDNVYTCGEGAGYAGGITSAAVDGIDCALKIMSRYKRKKQ